jgi:hypothetical protein
MGEVALNGVVEKANRNGMSCGKVCLTVTIIRIQL